MPIKMNGEDFMNSKKLKPIPKFKSLDEEATFWDTHDLTKYFDFSKMKRGGFVLEDTKKEKSLTIRLQPELIGKIKKMANNIGLSTSSLARMWFIEKLTTAK